MPGRGREWVVLHSVEPSASFSCSDITNLVRRVVPGRLHSGKSWAPSIPRPIEREQPGERQITTPRMVGQRRIKGVRG